MALYAGDTEAAKEYRRVFESGKKLSDDKLFNGEYYHQMLPAPGAYQLGAGSISEQIHGQLYARISPDEQAGAGSDRSSDTLHLRKHTDLWAQ